MMIASQETGGKTDTLTIKLGDQPDGVPEKLPERSSAGKALTPPKAPAGPRRPMEEKKDDENKS